MKNFVRAIFRVINVEYKIIAKLCKKKKKKVGVCVAQHKHNEYEIRTMQKIVSIYSLVHSLDA